MGICWGIIFGRQRPADQAETLPRHSISCRVMPQSAIEVLLSFIPDQQQQRHKRRRVAASVEDVGGVTPRTFVVGAWVRGPLCGLHGRTADFPWVTCLLTSLVRGTSPTHQFTSISVQQNVRTAPHVDRNNLQGPDKFSRKWVSVFL